MGEDCLYLNVWSKVSAKKNKPVVVFFHGGSEYLTRLYLPSKAKAALQDGRLVAQAHPSSLASTSPILRTSSSSL